MNFDELPHGDDVELVVMQAEEYEAEPETDVGEYVENVSTSLWLRLDEMEFPVFSHNEYGCWNSPSVDFQKNINENHATEAFIEGVARIPDGECNGYGNFDEEMWDEMSKAEQYIAHLIREAITKGERPDDPRWNILKICRQKIGLKIY